MRYQSDKGPARSHDDAVSFARLAVIDLCPGVHELPGPDESLNH
jgi:hypothetical protein